MPTFTLGSIPFAPKQEYDYGPSSAITQLILERGRANAERAASSGANWGNLVAGIGSTIAGGIEQNRAKKAEEAQSRMLSEELQNPDGPNWNRVALAVGPERADKLRLGAETLKATQIKNQQELEGMARAKADAILAAPEPMRAQLYDISRQNLLRLGVPAQALPEAYDEGFVRSQATPPKAGEGFTLKEGEVRYGADGKPIASGPAAAPKAPGTHVVGGNLVDDTGKVLFRAPKETAPKEAKHDWVMRDGKPVYIDVASIQPGDMPYESARTAVKKIPAGSAEELGQFDSGLDDLRMLGTSLAESGATGALARGGAALPNVVTEITGLGSEAKNKQAQIDRVKQIIGKTLEGGVLRKEDEEKYKKILPTISDPPELVREKIKGLEAAIQRKKSRQVDALEDAGYDMAAFRERAAKSAPASDSGWQQIGGFKVRVKQ